MGERERAKDSPIGSGAWANEEAQQGARGAAGEALKRKELWLQNQVFGTKTEKQSGPIDSSRGIGGEEVEGGKKAKREKQPGSKGYGRKDRLGLPIEEVVHVIVPGTE